jgi:hypothetical protein
MPEAEQGASSSTASKGRPSHQAAARRGRRRRCSSACRPQALQRVADPAQARGSWSSASRSRSGRLQQMGGLAARRGAGVEHPGARGQWRQAARAVDQQRRGKLRGAVLHRHVASVEARQLGHRTGWLQHQAVGCQGPQRACLQTGFQQTLPVGLGRAAGAVDAQAEGRRQLRGGQQLGPLRGPVALQSAHPPGRMFVTRLGLLQGLRQQRLALAHRNGAARRSPTGLRRRGAAPPAPPG